MVATNYLPLEVQWFRAGPRRIEGNCANTTFPSDIKMWRAEMWLFFHRTRFLWRNCLFLQSMKAVAVTPCVPLQLLMCLKWNETSHTQFVIKHECCMYFLIDTVPHDLFFTVPAAVLVLFIKSTCFTFISSVAFCYCLILVFIVICKILSLQYFEGLFLFELERLHTPVQTLASCVSLISIWPQV